MQSIHLLLSICKYAMKISYLLSRIIHVAPEYMTFVNGFTCHMNLFVFGKFAAWIWGDLCDWAELRFHASWSRYIRRLLSLITTPLQIPRNNNHRAVQVLDHNHLSPKTSTIFEAALEYVTTMHFSFLFWVSKRFIDLTSSLPGIQTASS